MNAVLRQKSNDELIDFNSIFEYTHILDKNSNNKSYRAFIKMNQNKFSQRMYKSEKNLVKAINETFDSEEEYNLFLSMNTFYKMKRATENISQLENLYIDLDYYKKNLRLESVLYFLEKDYFNSVIPEPNLIINSGQGLYLIWHIRPVPIRALPLWQSIQRYFLESLKEFGADAAAIDPVRFLRLPGTVNLKNNAAVSIIEKNETSYTINEIQEEYFKVTKKSSNKHKKTVGKVTKLFNTYSLYWARITDLIKLCELRQYDMEGHRELVLFLYRYWSCLVLDDEERALEDTLELNSRFTEKLKKREVIKATESAERYFKDKKYNYSNKRLVELLAITGEEQTQLKTIISKSEKYTRKNKIRNEKRRDETGLTKKQKEIIELQKKIKTLRQQGFTYVAIAKQLNKSVRTIKNYS